MSGNARGVVTICRETTTREWNGNRGAVASRFRHAVLVLGCAGIALTSVGAQVPASAPSKAPVSPPALAPVAPRDIRVDHSRFDALLRQHVVNGFVDYEAFAKAPEFALYLASLDKVHPETLGEDERLAYWINVYNAYTIQLIVTHHETETVRNINRTLGVLRLKGPWSEPLVHAAGRTLTLDDVQHRILRKEFGEPRVHFTLACAAIGCPPLRSEAYTGASLVDQLNDQAHRFLRLSPDKNRLDDRVLFLSPVLIAFRDDFGPSRRDLSRAISQWYDGEDRKKLASGPVFIRPTTFDWTLNSKANASKKPVIPPKSPPLRVPSGL